MLEKLRGRIAKWVAPKGKRQVRMYAAARSSRLTNGWTTMNSSADAELSSSLRTLRSRSRQLVRDAPYAKRAKTIVVNNVVGSGIGMQAQVRNSRGQLNARINDGIETAWKRWCRADSCHTGGAFHFAHFERAVIGQLFETGEAFVRLHKRPFGDSRVPLALELIEAERVVDDLIPSAVTAAHIRMGVEVDDFLRPVAYWIRKSHPSEVNFSLYGFDDVERVPADQIIHLKVGDRWPQTRGEPWLHAVATRLNDMDGYSEAEIVAARAAANYMGFIKTESPDNPLVEDQADGSRQMVMEPGVFEHLAPGEDIVLNNPNRPNPNMDPFMRLMLREVAAGVGVSYESLSRDYSQSNYSSSRLALLDDRDLWRVLQGWFICAFRDIVHREWMMAAVLSGAIPEIGVESFAMDMEKFFHVRFKPRGWSWIDPTSEVEAYKEAVRCGFTTVSDVIAQTANGRDIEDVLSERRQELDLMAEHQLMFTTDPETMDDGGAKHQEPMPPAPPEDRSVHLQISEGAVRVEPAQIKQGDVVVTVPERRTEVSVTPQTPITVMPATVRNEISVPPPEVIVREATEKVIERDEQGEIKRVVTRSLN